MSETCAWVTERLPEHDAGRLGDEERRRVEAHLAECALCARESRVVAALRRAPMPPPPEARWARLADDVAAEAVRARSARRSAFAHRAAAVIVVLAGASAVWWWVGRPSEQRLAEESPAAWDALMWTSGLPWSESVIPGWFTLDDLSASELEQLLEEVEST